MLCFLSANIPVSSEVMANALVVAFTKSSVVISRHAVGLPSLSNATGMRKFAISEITVAIRPIFTATEARAPHLNVASNKSPPSTFSAIVLHTLPMNSIGNVSAAVLFSLNPIACIFSIVFAINNNEVETPNIAPAIISNIPAPVVANAATAGTPRPMVMAVIKPTIAENIPIVSQVRFCELAEIMYIAPAITI